MNLIFLKCGLLTILLSFAIDFSCASKISIIPQPLKLIVLEGNFILPSKVSCEYSSGCLNEAEYLNNALMKRFNIQNEISSKLPTKVISLKLRHEEISCFGKEGYELKVLPSGVFINAAKPAGIFYGIQSLLQLIVKNTDTQYSVPCIDIYDIPRFSWRAFLLDEARTFQGTEIVKQLLDEMAVLKMNVFHWHLTDDQGWRIEIKKYPELIKINSPETLSEDLQKGDKNGYYSQEQIKEIVKYAAKRHITVVPEIEMPGHASAAIAAYPWLGVDKNKIEMPTKVTGIFLNTYDVSDPRTMKFLQDMLQEVKTLFPGGIIHIGGDEINFSKWKNSKNVNFFMKSNDIITPADLQIWFTNKISVILNRINIRMMGWNDIMGQNLHNYAENAEKDFKVKQRLAPQTIVHFWKGDLKLITETVTKGYEVVNSYHIFTYLDYPYENLSLQKAYSFDPIPDGLPSELYSKIIGLGCQMWGSSVCTIETKEKLHKQVFPRIAAYAEIGWTSKENKSFERFKSSLPFLITRWQSQGIKSIGPLDSN